MPPELSVYLVEDDPLLARHVREALDAAPGIRCVGHADCLADARAELPQRRPQVLLSDLGLPDGDATELIRELGGRDGEWHPHILVFSVFGDESRVIHAIEAGADGYFLKGCPDRELVRAVQAAALGESPISPAIARHLLRHFAAGGTAGAALSADEQQVLKLFAQGYMPEEIAERIASSAHGVCVRVRQVYEKLQQRHRLALSDSLG
ncbi:response regulator [Caldimonas tepidiphila]|uniref:response regulator n=1 Tax=Caldimonas tepidiphila TaxID=2315841 RepID=UPI000E5C2F0C|nr:response regulator transcription factor [Caldimonas tepidiphila]